MDGSCYLLSTASTLGCVGMKLSSDKKTCNYLCPLSDINMENGCFAPCTTPACDNCPANYIYNSAKE